MLNSIETSALQYLPFIEKKTNSKIRPLHYQRKDFQKPRENCDKIKRHPIEQFQDCKQGSR